MKPVIGVPIVHSQDERDEVNRQVSALSAHLATGPYDRYPFPRALDRTTVPLLPEKSIGRAHFLWPGSIVHDRHRIVYHPVSYEQEYKYVAYFVEHELGWTIRLDRSHTLRASEPFSVGSIVASTMPYLN
jgi:hypothetical protein